MAKLFQEIVETVSLVIALLQAETLLEDLVEFD